MSNRNNSAATPKQRDLRIDFFRGVALICIFVDHVPGNRFSELTLQNYGFSDAAELFVFLAGYSAVLAYARHFNETSFQAGATKVAHRLRVLYVWHLGVLVAGAALLYTAASLSGEDKYITHIGFQPVADAPVQAVLTSLALLMQPNLFNILPLYIVLLALFPFVYLSLRWNMVFTMVLLFLIWGIAGFAGINLPIVQSDGSIGAWLLNPFAWVLLLASGAATAMTIGAGKLRYSPTLLATCVAYLVFALTYAAPWTALPGLSELRVIDPAWFGTISKTDLSIWRLLHVLALAYTALILTSPQAEWLRLPIVRAVSMLGRHSLEVFVLGILLSLTGWIVFSELGDSLPVQIAVNAFGIIAMGVAAWVHSSDGEMLRGVRRQTLPSFPLAER